MELNRKMVYSSWVNQPQRDANLMDATVSRTLHGNGQWAGGRVELHGCGHAMRCDAMRCAGRCGARWAWCGVVWCGVVLCGGSDAGFAFHISIVVQQCVSGAGWGWR